MVINAPKAYKSRDAEELEDELCNQKRLQEAKMAGKALWRAIQRRLKRVEAEME